jgi:hypothetical protein
MRAMCIAIGLAFILLGAASWPQDKNAQPSAIETFLETAMYGAAGAASWLPATRWNNDVLHCSAERLLLAYRCRCCRGT